MFVYSFFAVLFTLFMYSCFFSRRRAIDRLPLCPISRLLNRFGQGLPAFFRCTKKATQPQVPGAVRQNRCTGSPNPQCLQLSLQGSRSIMFPGATSILRCSSLNSARADRLQLNAVAHCQTTTFNVQVQIIAS